MGLIGSPRIVESKIWIWVPGKEDVVTAAAWLGYCRGTSPTLIGHCRTHWVPRLWDRVSPLPRLNGKARQLREIRTTERLKKTLSM